MSEGARQPGRSHPSVDEPSPTAAARRTEPTDAVEAELSGHRGAVLHREKFVSRALATEPDRA